jgi:hypothetical protein
MKRKLQLISLVVSFIAPLTSMASEMNSDEDYFGRMVSSTSPTHTETESDFVETLSLNTDTPSVRVVRDREICTALVNLLPPPHALSPVVAHRREPIMFPNARRQLTYDGVVLHDLMFIRDLPDAY